MKPNDFQTTAAHYDEGRGFMVAYGPPDTDRFAIRCPKCGRAFKSHQGRDRHLKDYHKP